MRQNHAGLVFAKGTPDAYRYTPSRPLKSRIGDFWLPRTPDSIYQTAKSTTESKECLCIRNRNVFYPKMASSPRAEAASLVRHWLVSGRSPDLTNLDDSSRRGVVLEITLGTIRRYGMLRALRAHLASRDPAPAVEAVLLAGLYQLLYMDRKDQHAVVDESVSAVRAHAGTWAVPFVNAVLRRITREREQCIKWLGDRPLHVRHSHPVRLVERWRRRWPENRVERLAEWNNRPPRVVVRILSKRTSMDGFLSELEKASIPAAPHPFAPDRFAVLEPGVAVRNVPGYSRGLFVVQDPATAIAVSMLDVRPDIRILDLCAAPGGKTTAIAEQMGGDGILLAVDRRADRMHLLRDTLRRLSLGSVLVGEADGTDSTAMQNLMSRHDLDGFDRVLLDAPCTNTGVLRRRVEARWRFSMERLEQAARRQWKLLSACAELLSPGGILVYSTCSLEPEENSGLLSEWLHEHPGFFLERARWSIPPDNEIDGAFAARIRRRPPS